MADRERVLDAAEVVIRRDGAGASLEAIALEAGVTKPVVYARVGSRAELSDALAERLAARLSAATGERVAGTSLTRETLAGFVATTLQTLADHRELFAYVTHGGAEGTPARSLHLAAQSAGPLAHLLARWRARQGIHDETVLLPWAYGIIGMLNMVAMWWLAEGTPSASEVGDQLADLMWNGVRGER